jgi:hypothetical protein
LPKNELSLQGNPRHPLFQNLQPSHIRSNYHLNLFEALRIEARILWSSAARMKERVQKNLSVFLLRLQYPEGSTCSYTR